MKWQLWQGSEELWFQWGVSLFKYIALFHTKYATLKKKQQKNMFCQYDLLDRMFITLIKMTFQRISNIPRCYILWVVFDISLQCLWRLIKNIFLCVLTGPVSFSNQAFFLLMTYSLVNYLGLHTSSSLEIYYSFRPLRKTELCN